jgi:hypothetical protein
MNISLNGEDWLFKGYIGEDWLQTMHTSRGAATCPAGGPAGAGQRPV